MRIILTFLVLFLFSTFHIFSTDYSLIKNLPTKIKLILQNVEFGLKKNRLNAIRQCGVEMIQPCYRLLIQNLTDPDIEIRDYSAISLGRIQQAAAVTHIQSAIKEIEIDLSERKKINNKAGQSLEQITLNNTNENSKSTFSSIDEIEKIKEDRTKLLTKSHMVRALALIFKSTVQKIDPVIITTIESFLKDESPEVRINAAFGLSILRQNSSKLILETTLKEEKEDRVKIEILGALLSLEPYNHIYIGSLSEYLFSDNPDTRMQTAYIIKVRKLKETQKALDKALILEANENVRRVLFEAYATAIYQ